MGIRILCPNGHRLNIKSFLAGKRGICPHCDAKFDIPFQSDPAALNRERVVTGGSPSNFRPAPGIVDPPNPSVAALPPSDSNVAATSEADSPPLSGALNGDEPQGAASDPNDRSTAAERAPAESASEALVDDNPFSEEGVWYVRTAKGQQFGPADNVTMQQWIQQTRVTADCWIWRDSWPDWQQANVILGAPATATMITPPEVSTPPSITTDKCDQPILGRGPNRQRTRSRTMFAVATLGVICLVLLCALIYVVSR